jgi:hypothetical protein
MASNAVALSAFMFMPLLAGDCLTTVDSQLDATPLTQLNSVGRVMTASEQTQQKTLLPTVLLLRHVAVAQTMQKTPLPTALLLLHDVTAEVTCSSVACAIIVMLISCLLCCNLVTVLYVLQSI